MREETIDWFAKEKQPVHLIIRRRPHYLGRKQVEEAIEEMYDKIQAGFEVSPRWRVWDIWEMAGHFRPVEGDLDSFEELREELLAIRRDMRDEQQERFYPKLLVWMDFAADWPW